ncbi:MAG TPA: hypothetical protein VFL73_10715 [Solirubrobacteraceae bacterium]|nr:hypothetical protein [Solirubrobacteraceae bacterium]
MAGFTPAEQKATLDARFPTSGATDYIAFSTDGSTEAASVMPRMAVGATGWAAATAGDPAEKPNAAKLTTPAALATGTLTQWAVMSAASGGTQRTKWNVLKDSTGAVKARAVAAGDTLTFEAGTLKVTLN